MKPKSAIAKGKILENFIVERLIKTGLDSRAYRQKGSGSGLNKGDVWNCLNLCFEAKNTATFQAKAYWEQAKRESLGQIPVVVWHQNNIPLEESKVMVDWGFFEELLLAWKSNEPKEQNLGIPKWKLTKLKDDINSVLKDI